MNKKYFGFGLIISAISILFLSTKNALGSLTGITDMTNVDETYFADNDFIRGGVDWQPYLSDDFIQKLNDTAATLLSAGIIMKPSPASGAIGRKTGDTKSQHYVNNNEVKAIDVMFSKNGKRLSNIELTQVFYTIKSLNFFSGLGVYPEWQPLNGMHLDMRYSSSAENPALWGAVKDVDNEQTYVSIQSVLTS